MLNHKKHAAFQFEKDAFFLAVSFLTRFPVPRTKYYSLKLQHHAVAYYPVVGGIIGLLLALVWCISEPLLDIYPTAVLVVFFSFFITGALHEDGLADTCDGLFGGRDITHKLRIMKDSRIGVYGVLALWFSLSLRTVLIASLSDPEVVIVIAASLSRTCAALIGLSLPYRQADENAKSKGLLNKLDGRSKIILFGSLFIILCFSTIGLLASTLIFIVMYVFHRSWFKRAIGGYTGDCLGAAQQITELTFYLLAVAVLGNNGGI